MQRKLHKGACVHFCAPIKKCYNITSARLVMKSYLLLGAASVALSAGVSAQTAEDTQRTEETVFVTAPGAQRTADELIGNATAFDRDEIIENLSASLGETLLDAPGVSSTAFGQGASRPVLRGLGAERVQVLTNGIGAIDASTASPDHQVTADGIDAERIEILRGPAALAYGGQSIGGVVNVIDGLIVEELPDEALSADGFAAFNSVNEGTELAGRAQYTTGPFVLTLSASMRDFEDFDIPDFAESEAFRAAEEAEEEEHDEDEDHEEEEEVRGTLENSFVETDTLAAGLSWVGDTAFFGVAVRNQNATYGLPGHGEHGHGEEEHEDEDEDHDEEEHEEEEESPFIELEQTRIDVRGGLTFDSDVLTDLTGTFAIVDYEHVEFEAPGETGTVYANEGYEGRIELGHTLFGFDGAAGLQFISTDFSAIGAEAFISPTESELFGLFVYESKEWDSGIGLEGGLRYETVERDNVNFGTVEFDLASGSLGLHRHFDGGFFLGGQVSYTERAPADTELFADGPHLATDQFEVGDPTLGKESGLNLEGTARWSGENYNLGLNVFVTDFSDFIYLTPGETFEDGALVSEADGLPVFVFTQQDANFVGLEAYGEFTFSNALLGADWVFDASYDFVKAELADDGNVPFIPPTMIKSGLTAEWDAFEVGAKLTVAGDQNDIGVGQLATDGYAVIDLKAATDLSHFGWSAEGTKAFIEARNITDEEVRYATSVVKDIAPAPGQNIRVGLRIAF